MNQDIIFFLPAIEGNFSKTPVTVKTPHLASAMLLFATFLVGLMGNGLYLWMLGLKTRRTVTTVWFLHLVSCYFLFTLLIPFFTVYVLLGFHRVSGMAICKLLNSCISLGMFTSVFLLTLISLDRYILIHHPIWCRHHRTVPRAICLVMGAWLISFALSIPYFAFLETHVMDGGKIICINKYVSRDWNGTETQDLGRCLHFAVFVVRFLLSFCTIVGWHGRVALKMKEKKLVLARKPFKVMVAVVVSLFLSWLPYHLYHGLKLYMNEAPGLILVICTFMSCFNACFTHVLYLFIGEKFWQVFRMSFLTLVKSAFIDNLGSSGPKSRG